MAYEKVGFDFKNAETKYYVEPIEGPGAEFIQLFKDVRRAEKALKPSKNSWRSSSGDISAYDQHNYNECVKALWHFMQEQFNAK